MTMKCGWGFADITPRKPVNLYGQYYARVSEKVHQKLKVTALVLEKDDSQMVMLNADVVNIHRGTLEAFKEHVKGKIDGLKLDNLIMHATHTHSAPSPNVEQMISWLHNEKDQIQTKAYQLQVFEAMTDALRQALGNMRPAGIAGAFTQVTVGHCRRAVYDDLYAEMYGDTTRSDFSGMEGVEDSGVELMFFYDENKKPTGAIVNVACPSQIMEATYSVSSDFAGRCRELLKERFGKDFQMIYQISAGGCQSPRDLTRPLERSKDFWSENGVEIVGSKLCNAVCEKLTKVETIDFNPEMELRRLELALPLRVPGEDEVVQAKKKLEELERIMPEREAFEAFCDYTHANEKIPGRPGPYDSKLHHFVKIRNNQAVLKRVEHLKNEKDINVEVQVAKLGNYVFASNPFELYLDYGQRIKSRSKANQTFIIQLANGANGYLPSRRAEILGGYGGMIINGTTGHDGGKILCDETVKTINTMFE